MPCPTVPLDLSRLQKFATEGVPRGDADAQVRLGHMHYMGADGPKNHVEARRLYRLSAEQGNAEAQATLGQMNYRLGHVELAASSWSSGALAMLLWMAERSAPSDASDASDASAAEAPAEAPLAEALPPEAEPVEGGVAEGGDRLFAEPFFLLFLLLAAPGWGLG